MELDFDQLAAAYTARLEADRQKDLAEFAHCAKSLLGKHGISKSELEEILDAALVEAVQEA